MKNSYNCNGTLTEEKISDLLGNSFITCDSDGEGGYSVSVKTETMDDAHALHGLLIKKIKGAIISKFDQLKERERRCPTMAEAESRALLRSLQEICELVGLDGSNSPREIVEAVRVLTLSGIAGKAKTEEGDSESE